MYPSEGPILVAVDFSPGSEAALSWAADSAKASGAPLLVLHVAHDPPDAPGSYDSDDDLSRIEEVATEKMHTFLIRMRTKLPTLQDLDDFRTSVVVGLPANRILEIAEESGARSIVMGAQGRSALADVLLGSKVERVTRHASIPVTIVRAPPRKPSSS